MKRALIYDPYLDTLGGGERYCLTVAECLLKDDWRVDLFWDDKGEIDRAERRFNLEIGKIGVVGEKPEKLSFFRKLKLTRKYDFVFWLSDGSLPFLFGKKNLLHFQVPFVGVRKNNLFKKIKLKLIDQIICNSRFTKKYIDQEFGTQSLVLYPPVDVKKFKPSKKENLILAVGRFEETMQAKRQDVLIEAFKNMVDEGLAGWQLVLAGGSLQKENENVFLDRLKKMAKNYPIDFAANVSFNQLQDLYGRAKIFWHATGFGIDEKKEPWRVEHFGMTTVEAMAAGCVPVVIDKGGLREIVRRGMGERWGTDKELVSLTLDLVKNSQKLASYRRQVQKQAEKFSKKNFYNRLSELVFLSE